MGRVEEGWDAEVLHHPGRAKRDPGARGHTRVVGPWVPGLSLRDAPE